MTDEDRFPDLGGLLTRYRLADLMPKAFTISNVRSILARGHRLVMVYELCAPGRFGRLNVVADDITSAEMYEIETMRPIGVWVRYFPSYAALSADLGKRIDAAARR